MRCNIKLVTDSELIIKTNVKVGKQKTIEMKIRVLRKSVAFGNLLNLAWFTTLFIT